MTRKKVVRRSLLALSLCGVILAVAWIWLGQRSESTALADSLAAEESAAQSERLTVDVVKPTPGGMPRSTTLPGTVIAFESAQLFAKVSGYLKSQAVDIGDTVHRGQVLAEIDCPETLKALDQSKAAVDQAKAQVAQADARVTTAEADKEAALAAITTAQAGILRYTSARQFREKQFQRISDLYKSNSVEKRLVDEQESELQSARSAEDAAAAQVVNAKALANAAEARIAQARADALAARANVEVTEAARDKAEVLVAYLKIVSPYDGVVTKRNFFRGDFIRSADQQATLPLLAVDRTNKMRVVVQVPDRDVPFTRPGAPAIVKIDALPDTPFQGKVARVAEAEHSETRSMRTEIDLDNDKDLLCHGMYGYVTIQLPSSPGAMRIPTSALVGPATDGVGVVDLVKDGVVEVKKVRVGRDNGAQIEVLAGLSAGDDVAITHTTELTPGMNVTAVPAHPKSNSNAQPQAD